MSPIAIFMILAGMIGIWLGWSLARSAALNEPRGNL